MMKKIFLILILLPFIGLSQEINRTLLYDGNNRNFIIYIPQNYTGNNHVPLLFDFHGGNGTASITNEMKAIADTAGFIFVAPQALADPGDGGSFNWLHKAPTNHDDIYFVESIIDTLSSEYMINNDRIYIRGYSLGGEFVYELACRLNHRIAAGAAVARTMQQFQYDNCTPVHPTAIQTILGLADSISPYNGLVWGGVSYYVSADLTHSYWATYNNTNINPTVIQIPDIDPFDGSTVERRSWLNGDNCVTVEELKVIGGGHDWPGYFGNMDIDANIEIWNFVSKYDINGLINCNLSAIQEFQDTDKLIRIVDILGREVSTKFNSPLFYIYESGRVSKKIILQ